MNNPPSSSAPPPSIQGPANWELDLLTGKLHCGEARARMMGYEPDEIEPSCEWWDRMLHPEERVAVHLARSRHLQGIDSGYRSEYRAQRRDGRWLWLLEVGCIIRDRAGTALRVHGVVLDITTDREHQFHLQQRLERLDTLFDYTCQFTGLLSPEGRLLEISRSALSVRVVPRSEALGKFLWESALGPAAPGDVEEMTQAIARAARGEAVRLQIDAPLASSGDRHVIDISLRPIFNDEGVVTSILSEGRDVTEVVVARQALRTFEDRLTAAASTANLGLFDIDLATGAGWHNDRCSTMLGYKPGEVGRAIELWLSLIHPDDALSVQAMLEERRESSGELRADFRLRAKDGSWRWIHTSGHSIVSSDPGTPPRLAGVQLDVTERKESELRLHASERLEAVGKLAAGVAHEINTPVQFVSDSIYFVRDGLYELLALTERLSALAARDPCNVTSVQALRTHLPYLIENLPKSLERSLDGLKRVTEIVNSMRELAHPDRPEMSQIDLNHIIRNALVVARSEYKYVADVQTDFEQLSPVWCHAGELNQVIINLLVNASHAIADAVEGKETRGIIRVSSRMDGDEVLLSIADTGAGIAENIRHRVFEPFFTTKDVGRGTGQGLAISRNIIVKRHCGSLDFESTVGKGTVFHVRLPRDCRSEPMASAAECAA